MEKERNCKACGEPVEGYGYWCSDTCWRDEDGGWGDEDGPSNDDWRLRY